MWGDEGCWVSVIFEIALVDEWKSCVTSSLRYYIISFSLPLSAADAIIIFISGHRHLDTQNSSLVDFYPYT